MTATLPLDVQLVILALCALEMAVVLGWGLMDWIKTRRHYD